MSTIKHKEQRVGVFIDAQNMYHTAKNLFGHKVNFGKIVEDAVAGRKLVRAIAYLIASESGEEQGFFEALHKVGIETKVKDLQIFSSGAKKADWDVAIAVDAITMAPKLDTVILLSGDGDFIPMVEYLQIHSGIQVESHLSADQVHKSLLKPATTLWTWPTIQKNTSSVFTDVNNLDRVEALQKSQPIRIRM